MGFCLFWQRTGAESDGDIYTVQILLPPSSNVTQQTQIFVNNSWQLWETSIWEHLYSHICSESFLKYIIYILFTDLYMQISAKLPFIHSQKFCLYWLLLERLDNNSQLKTNWQPLPGHWRRHTWRSFIWMEKAFWPLQWTSACWQLVYY